MRTIEYQERECAQLEDAAATAYSEGYEDGYTERTAELKVLHSVIVHRDTEILKLKAHLARLEADIARKEERLS